MRGQSKTTWRVVIATILFFAIIFMIGLTLHAAGTMPWGDWNSVVNFVVVFLLLGAYFGTIVALDSDAGFCDADMPVSRSALCGVFAGITVFHVQYWLTQSSTLAGPATGFFIGALLGWLGWTWAKYVDF